MSSGEKLGGGVVKSEVVGEEERKSFEDRGEKTLSAAEREKRIKELQEERARLLSRNKEIEEELKRLEQEENISKQQEQAERDEIQSHIANPDEYWENVKRYNHDELEKLNDADPQANPADPNQAALDKARAYNEAHAGEMYENWQEGQDLPKNETEEQWAAFYQNQGEEFGANKTNEVQPAVAQANQASAQATEVPAATEPGATTAEANTAETESDDELTDEEAEVVAAAEALPDTPEMPEVVKRLKEKGKNSKGLKKFLIGAATAAVIALVLAGIIKPTGDAKAKAPVNNPKQIEQTMETGTVDESEEEQNTGIDYESEKGIIDGYNKKGMFLSPNKGGKYDFAAAKEVAEVCNNDECEMIKYAARNQVECLADYIANMPEELQPEGFKGLSILEAETKIESLTPEEYNAVFKTFCNGVDKAFTRRVVLDGNYENASMREKDEAKAATHSNMELVKCVTTENGVKVNQFYWLDKDGNEIGSMTIKIFYDENGDIVGGCMQIVHKEGTTDTTDGMKKITEDPDPPSSGSEGTGSEGTGSEGTGSEGTDIQSKDPENLIRIDNKINDEIAQDIGTGEIDNYVNPGVREDDKTPTPSFEQDTMVTNPDSGPAPEVAPTVSDNNYSNNNGGANSGYRPVSDDERAQQNADSGNYTMPNNIEQADDALADFGIN